MKIRSILVPIDFSECSTKALIYAAGLAEPFGAGMVLLHVVEPTPGAEHHLSLTPAFDDTHHQLLQSARDRLTALAEKTLGARSSVEILVRIGRAPSEIADTANALGTDLIVMGTHGATAVKHMLLGSTSEKVVRHAKCQVLTVRWAGD